MAGKAWRKALRCESGACAEVLIGDGVVRVRDSKNPDIELTFTMDEWTAFRDGIRAGNFD